MQLAIIYALTDPFTGAVRYVGKTVRPKQRLERHLTAARHFKGSNPHNERWIRSVLDRGGRPVMQTLEDGLTADKWSEREVYWIEQLRSKGASLTNIAKGGEGGSKQKWDYTEADPLLGKHSDSTVSRLTGIPRGALNSRRQMLGIPGYTAFQWTPEREAMLGTQSNQALADLWGTTKDVVGYRRRSI